MEENVIQMNWEITITVDMSVKTIIFVKKIIFRILLHLGAKIVNI